MRLNDSPLRRRLDTAMKVSRINQESMSSLQSQQQAAYYHAIVQGLSPGRQQQSTNSIQPVSGLKLVSPGQRDAFATQEHSINSLKKLPQKNLANIQGKKIKILGELAASDTLQANPFHQK